MELINKILATKARMSGLENKRTSLGGEIAEITESKLGIEAEKQAILDTIYDIENRIDVAKDNLESARGGLKRAQQEVKSATKKIDELTIERSTITQESIDEMDAWIKATEDKGAEIISERDKISSQIEDLNNELKALQSELVSHDMSLEFLEPATKSKHKGI